MKARCIVLNFTSDKLPADHSMTTQTHLCIWLHACYSRSYVNAVRIQRVKDISVTLEYKDSLLFPHGSEYFNIFRLYKEQQVKLKKRKKNSAVNHFILGLIFIIDCTFRNWI